METDNIIILNDEQGDEVEFEFLDLIEYAGKEYVVPLPLDEPDGAAEVVILKVEDTDEELESYVTVSGDETLQAVFEIFRLRMKYAFNFID